MRLEITYDGPIVTEHRVTIRMLSKTLMSFQRGLDRACIYNEYGRIWKYAKMNPDNYTNCDLLFRSEPGSFKAILEVVNDHGTLALQKVKETISLPYQIITANFENRVTRLKQDYADRTLLLLSPTVVVQEYYDVIRNTEYIERYIERSICKEIDQLLSVLRTAVGNSEIKIEFINDDGVRHTYIFNRDLSHKFHQHVSHRELGTPIQYMGLVFEMNSKTLRAKIEHFDQTEETKGQSLIHFVNKDSYLDFNQAVRTNEVVAFIGSPVLENNSFDPISGDIFYLDGAEKIIGRV